MVVDVVFVVCAAFFVVVVVFYLISVTFGNKQLTSDGRLFTQLLQTMNFVCRCVLDAMEEIITV